MGHEVVRFETVETAVGGTTLRRGLVADGSHVPPLYTWGSGEPGAGYLPGRTVHEAWVPAGSRAISILEDGWKVSWLDGPPLRPPPTVKDIGKGTPLGNA